MLIKDFIRDNNTKESKTKILVDNKDIIISDIREEDEKEKDNSSNKDDKYNEFKSNNRNNKSI